MSDRLGPARITQNDLRSGGRQIIVKVETTLASAGTSSEAYIQVRKALREIGINDCEPRVLPGKELQFFLPSTVNRENLTEGEVNDLVEDLVLTYLDNLESEMMKDIPADE